VPRTKKRREAASPSALPTPLVVNGPTGEVLTLDEAAAYLRLSEPDVLRLVKEQGLPARQLGKEWRFLKTAIQAWLCTPLSMGHKQGIWAAAGALKDDPYLPEMLKELDRMRGRPVTEEG
jgi:excisionase family DNA binding protein